MLVETAAQKTTRIAKYAAANAAIIFVTCQSAFLCEEGRAIAVGHHCLNSGGMHLCFSGCLKKDLL